MAERIEAMPTTVAPRHSEPTLRRILGPDWRIALPFIAPVIILMVVFIAWPFIRAIYTSMTARSIGREVRFVGLDNYIRLGRTPSIVGPWSIRLCSPQGPSP